MAFEGAKSKIKYALGTALGLGVSAPVIYEVLDYTNKAAQTVSDANNGGMGANPIALNATLAIEAVLGLTAAICYAYKNYVGKETLESYVLKPGDEGASKERVEAIFNHAKGLVSREKKESLASLLEDLRLTAKSEDVAYELGFKKGEKDTVYVKVLERGKITGLTYTDEVDYLKYKLQTNDGYKRLGTVEQYMQEPEQVQRTGVPATRQGRPARPANGHASRPAVAQRPAPVAPETKSHKGADLGKKRKR